jgi:hypothetical protein
MSTQHARIAARAHVLWELRGRPEGSPEIDWYEAEKQLQGDANAAGPKATVDPLAQRAADILDGGNPPAASDDGTGTTPPDRPLPKGARPRRKAARQRGENGAARE